MKKLICLCLLLVLSVIPVSAAETYIAETEFPVSETTEKMQLRFYGKAGAEVSYEVLLPDKSLPEDALRESILNSFGLLGQAQCDEDGLATVSYIPEGGAGIYRVRANGASKIICVPEKELPDYYALAWSDSGDAGDEDVIYPMYELTQATLGDGKDPSAAAQTAAEALRQMPEGRRGIRLGSWYNFKLAYPIAYRERVYAANNALTQAKTALEQAANEEEKQAAQLKVNACTAEQQAAQEALLSYDNYGWWDKGGAIIKAELEAFFEEMVKTGVTVDYFICDFEEGMTVWSLGHDNDKYLPRYQAIEQDERYQTELRPLLAERGFVFCEDADKCELYYACHFASRTISEAEKSNYLIFNEVMSNRKAEYLNRCVFAPYLAAYPNGKCSNYNTSQISGANMLSQASHATYKGGSSVKAGTHSSPSLYGQAYALAQSGYNGDTMPTNGFMALVYNQNLLRATDDFELGKKTMPWVARENFVNSGYYFGTTPWYYENVLHSGLTDPEAFLFWGPRYYANDDAEMVSGQAEILADLMRELELMVGDSDRKTLETEPCSWNTHFLLSGMQSGNRRVWRITPDTVGTDTTVESFCTDRKTPTFTIDGVTITFPNCSVMTLSSSRADGGYWVMGSKEDEPVVTYDAEKLSGKAEYGVSVFQSHTGIVTNTFKNNDVLTIRLEYHNQTTSAQTMRLLAAGYQDNRLVYVKPLAAETASSGAEGYRLLTLSTTGDETEVRVFLWGSGMNPLLATVRLTE